jgi:hypothetical protein
MNKYKNNKRSSSNTQLLFKLSIIYISFYYLTADDIYLKENLNAKTIYNEYYIVVNNILFKSIFEERKVLLPLLLYLLKKKKEMNQILFLLLYF